MVRFFALLSAVVELGESDKGSRGKSSPGDAVDPQEAKQNGELLRHLPSELPYVNCKKEW